MTGAVRIGTSGWVYAPRERFYPKGLPQTRRLEYYSERFDTVELNNPLLRRGAHTRQAAGLCVIDTPKWPTRGAVTADFVYLRFHGQTRLHAGSYEDAALRGLGERIRTWRDRGLDAFAYFNNDEAGHAPRDALRLRELVG